MMDLHGFDGLAYSLWSDRPNVNVNVANVNVVGSAERLASKPSASHLSGLTPCLPPIVAALLH